MIDKMPFDFIRHKSKAAPKRTHSKIPVARRYTFQKQPRIIKHNCLFHTVFIKLFVTFFVETAFIIFNCKLSIFFATLSVIIVTQQICPSAIKFDIINAFFVIKSDIFPFRNAVRYITIFHLGKEKDA